MTNTQETRKDRENLWNEIKKQRIVIHVVFEGRCLNGDEGTGSNFARLHKMTIKGKEYAYYSWEAISRHYYNILFDYLGWKATDVDADGNVVALDATKHGILDSEEMATRGYLYLIGNKRLSRRKAVVFSDAISLYPYTSDIALHANHDFVKRARMLGYANVEPTPVYKEKSYSIYVFTCIIDVLRIGEHIIIDVVNSPNNPIELGDHYKITIKHDDNPQSTPYDITIPKQGGKIEELMTNKTGSRKILKVIMDESNVKKIVSDFLHVLRGDYVYFAQGTFASTTPLLYIAYPHTGTPFGSLCLTPSTFGLDANNYLMNVDRVLSSKKFLKNEDKLLIYAEDSPAIRLKEEHKSLFVSDFDEFLSIIGVLDRN